MFMNMAISRQKRNYVSVGIYTLLSIIIGISVVPFYAEVGAVAARTLALAIACIYAIFSMKDYLNSRTTWLLGNNLGVLLVVISSLSLCSYLFQVPVILSTVFILVFAPLMLFILLNPSEKDMFFSIVQQIITKIKKIAK
jgi:hypothetical protein